jgi:hypothetical protein
LTDRPVEERAVAPFCPMLSQGWSYLRAKEISLPPSVDGAGDHLLPSLWTAFDPDGMDIVIGALREGSVR